MKKFIFLLVTIFTLTACSNNTVKDESIKDPNENVPWDLIPMIFIDDKLYLYSGEKKIYDEVTDFDGEIESTVDQTKEPTKNNQSNFGTGYKYKILDEGKTINLYLDDTKLIIFKMEKDRK